LFNCNRWNQQVAKLISENSGSCFFPVFCFKIYAPLTDKVLEKLQEEEIFFECTWDRLYEYIIGLVKKIANT